MSMLGEDGCANCIADSLAAKVLDAGLVLPGNCYWRHHENMSFFRTVSVFRFLTVKSERV